MLTDEDRARAARQAKWLADAMKRSKEYGTLAVPEYDSQEDLDRCHPEEKGTDFRKFNEFNHEVLKGLIANDVLGTRVTFRYADFLIWLDGRPVSPTMRAAYGAYLIAEASHMN
jgi:hypothetical protein